MSFVLAYTTDAGELSMFFPAQDTSLEEARSCCPAGAVNMPTTNLPNTDWDFVNAWELSGQSITINFAKAQDITKARLREQRKPLLAELDVAFQRALETGAPTADIVAEKQRLRDITLLPDSATTLEELRAITCAKPN